MKFEVAHVVPDRPSAHEAKRRKLGYFFLANLLGLGIGAGIVVALGRLPIGAPDHALGALWAVLSRHPGVTALLASLPFFTSVLIGQREMRRTFRKRR